MKGTEIYTMNKIVRGKCFIINNEMALWKESLRFQHIFYQLNFEVNIDFKMTAQKMKTKFESIVKDPKLSQSNAFVLMIISHGCDESILGYNSITDTPDSNDVLKISEIVDIFSGCKSLDRKPKLFFFTCCRLSKSS